MVANSADREDSVSKTHPTDKNSLLCPSAQPDWPDAVVFGIVGGSAEKPLVSYIDKPLPVTQEILLMTEPLLPTEVLRIAAPCASNNCQHFANGVCSLAGRTVKHLEPVVDRLPKCGIRPACRWWNEQGKAACMRCPQVITDGIPQSEPIALAAIPPIRSS